MRPLTPCIWFMGNGLEAVRLYVRLFPQSKIKAVTYYDAEASKAARMPNGAPLTILFQLLGREYLAINAGPEFPQTEAFSLIVHCKTQKEIDTYTRKLTARGGQIGHCGWLKDRFGLSWQVVPESVEKMMVHKDKVKRSRMLKELFTMNKLNIARLEAAFHGRPATAQSRR